MRDMGEFDGLDEELFAERLDYSDAPLGAGSRAVSIIPLTFPEPATVRLRPREPRPTPERLDPPAPRGTSEDDREPDPVVAIALGGLLVLVLISAGVVLWWLS